MSLAFQIPELINSLLTYMLPDIPDGNTTPLMHLLNEPWDPVGKSVYRFEKVCFDGFKNDSLFHSNSVSRVFIFITLG